MTWDPNATEGPITTLDPNRTTDPALTTMRHTTMPYTTAPHTTPHPNATCHATMKCDEIIDLKKRVTRLEDALESAVKIIVSLNHQINNQSQEIEILKDTTENLDHQFGVLQEDFETLEDKVFPEEIPASCFQLAERGEFTDGIYKIRPAVDVTPFQVECKFK